MRLDEPGNRQGELLLDRCPQCRGLWLDRGEMETLIRSEGPGANAADAAAGEVAEAGGPAEAVEAALGQAVHQVNQ